MEQEQTSTEHRFIKYMKKIQNVPIVYDFITYVEHKKKMKYLQNDNINVSKLWQNIHFGVIYSFQSCLTSLCNTPSLWLAPTPFWSFTHSALNRAVDLRVWLTDSELRWELTAMEQCGVFSSLFSVLDLKACCHYEQTHMWLSQWLRHKADENQDHNYDFLSILFLSPRTAVLHPSNSLKLQAGSLSHYTRTHLHCARCAWFLNYYLCK